MACLIHYSNLKLKNSKKLTDIDEIRHKKLVDARNARRTLGGNYFHYAQCNAVTDQFVEGRKYHRECYNYFIKAMSDLAKSSANSSSISHKPIDKTEYESSRPKRSRETDSAGCFPSYCMFCKKDEIRPDRSSREYHTRVTTPLTAANILKAATLRHDKTLYDKINGINLMDKDFRKHRSCLNDYCSVVYNEPRKIDSSIDEYALVRKAVSETVIQDQKTMSLDSLMDLKGIKMKNRDSRRNMKSWLTRNYKDDIVFLQHESNKGQYVMSKAFLESVGKGEKITSETFPLSNDETIKRAAEILRSMIVEYTSEAEILAWPPTVESLKDRFMKMPELLINFFKLLLAPSDRFHVTAESTKKLAESFAQDMIFAISKGKFLTLKHTSVGLGLHNMTGTKIPIIILSQLGHSISYHQVREVETGQAELASKFAKEGMSLPILPRNDSSSVPTIFWWDNFDRFVDNLTGGGSIHNTPGVAFQEETLGTVKRVDRSIKRSNRSSLSYEEAPPPKVRKINPKKPPEIFQLNRDDSGEQISSHEKFIYLWKSFRKLNEDDQTFPRFAGFIINMFNTYIDMQKTVMTYLPPIETPISEYGTLFEVFYRSEKMAQQANLKYTHITFDCGAAMKAYHVIWNNPDRFKHIFLHLGDFHTTQAFFGTIGSYISGSGFEDIVFQLGLCQPGSMNALIKGKHYNQAWLIHESFAEAIFRLFIESYMEEEIVYNVNSEGATIDDLLQSPENSKFIKKCLEVQTTALEGGYGKTAQFWMRYVSLIDLLHRFHFALQCNDYEEKLKCLRAMLPIFFFFDRTHYSRYGSFYLSSLENIEETHPGAKEELMNIGISVRRNNYGIGQAVDLAGEQSYMRDAKTSGGITSFQTNKSSVMKWVRSRPFQAKFTEALREMSNMRRTSDDPKKCLRPSEILKSERIVSRIFSCIKDQFISPFDHHFEYEKLYNIVSGAYVTDDISTSLLNLDTIGMKCFLDFNKRLVSTEQKAFFDSISRNKQKTFKSSDIKLKVVNASKEEIRIERDVLGTLLASGCQEGRAVCIDKALEYPLLQVCPSLSTSDGKRRKTAKSNLFTAVSDMETVSEDEAHQVCKTYMVDLAAYVRSVIKQCKTPRDIAKLLMRSIPASYETIYVVCDTYDTLSIKSSERNTRGSGERCILKSPDMRIPYDINSYLSVGENKEELFNLVRRSLREDNADDRKIFFCLRNCYQIKHHEEIPRPDLYSDHEEADTKLVAYAKLESENVMIRSPSGDIDIIILFVNHFNNSNNKIFLDNGTGTTRKIYDIRSCNLSYEQSNALLGIHSFSGNDYLSSFFRKGKKTCWKKMMKEDKFVAAFSDLGADFRISEDTKIVLEQYLCTLYGKSNIVSLNKARSAIFWKHYEDEKIVELCLLPPCFNNFEFHLKRSNYIAYLFKHAHLLVMDIESPSLHGWNGTDVQWSEDYYPTDIVEILIAAENLEVEDEVDESIFDVSDDVDVEIMDFE